MSKRIRQYIGIFSAVVAYYIVHEGAHLLTALYYGVFKQINFIGLGMQIDVYAERMSNFQMGFFCIAGAVSTLLFGWLLVLLCRRVCTASSKVFKTVMWYTSLAILLLDPLYLSVLCGFFGGGDMNGIKLLFPEIAVRIVFAVIGVIHGIWKNILMAWNWCLQVASPTVLQDPCTMIGCCQSGSSVSGKMYPSSTASAVPISSRMAGSTHCKRKTFVRRQGKQISTIGQ